MDQSEIKMDIIWGNNVKKSWQYAAYFTESGHVLN